MPFNYRSTNQTGYTHHGGALVIGTELGSGIELNPTSSGAAPTILPAGDEANKSLIISGKGTGGVSLGSSGTAMSQMTMSLLQFTVPVLSTSGTAGASVDSTVTFAGATTNSIYILQQRTNWNSTQALGVMVAVRSSAVDELTLTFTNTGASSLSGSTASGYLLQFRF